MSKLILGSTSSPTKGINLFALCEWQSCCVKAELVKHYRLLCVHYIFLKQLNHFTSNMLLHIFHIGTDSMFESFYSDHMSLKQGDQLHGGGVHAACQYFRCEKNPRGVPRLCPPQEAPRPRTSQLRATHQGWALQGKE